MKLLFSYFLTACLLFNSLSLSAQENMPASHVPNSTPTSTSSPNIPPPNDQEGPVFPVEDLIPKPTKDTDKFLSEFINMLATLGLIIALILIVAWFLKRLVNTRLEQINITSAIQIKERRALSPKSALYLLSVQDKMILIAESHNGVTRLAEFGKPEEESAEPTERETPQSFRKLLERPGNKA